MSKDIFLFFMPWCKFTCKPKAWKTKVGCEVIFLQRLVLSAPAASGTGKALSGADFYLRSSQSWYPDELTDSRTEKFCCFFVVIALGAGTKIRTRVTWGYVTFFGWLEFWDV